VQYRFGVLERLFGNLGLRVDSHQSFDPEVTWRAGLAYLLPETATKLKASYATGFRAPSLSERFGQSVFSLPGFGLDFPFMGNPNLAPETSRSWEAGFEQALWQDRLRFGALYFATAIDDLIVTTEDFASYRNLGRADIWGIESFVAIEPVDWLTLTLDHTFTRAEDAQTGRDLLRRPMHLANLAVIVRPLEAATISVTGRYFGGRVDGDPITFARIRPGGFTVFDLAASYRLDDHFTATARIDNLLDRRYQNPAGFAHPGISVLVGLRGEW